MDEMQYQDWLKLGIEQNWCGPAVCYTHDGLPTSESEDQEFEEGDPCIHIIRLYEDDEVKAGVEANHSPSIWRATNQGIDL
jgi:hypothetical protein